MAFQYLSGETKRTFACSSKTISYLLILPYHTLKTLIEAQIHFRLKDFENAFARHTGKLTRGNGGGNRYR